MAETEVPGRRSPASAISDGLVSLHKRYYGRGPTQAKTYVFDEVVVSLLRGGFTLIEQTLIERGSAGMVEEMRRHFQDAMRQEFTAVVEEQTGRSVIAYLSQIHSDPEIAAEVFVLEPGGTPLQDQHESGLETD